MNDDKRSEIEKTSTASGAAGAVNALHDRVGPQLEAAKRRLGTLTAQVKALVDEHPAASLLAAAALGFVVARALRRPRR